MGVREKKLFSASTCRFLNTAVVDSDPQQSPNVVVIKQNQSCVLHCLDQRTFDGLAVLFARFLHLPVRLPK